MINKYSKFILVCLAYLPLLWIFLVRFWVEIVLLVQYWGLFGTVIFSFFIIIMTRILLTTSLSLVPSSNSIKIKDAGNLEVLAFFVTYLFPFIPNTLDIYSLGAVGIIYFLVIYIYIQSDLFAINILLKIIFKYNIFIGSIESQQKKAKIFILSKKDYDSGLFELNLIQLTKSLYLEKS